MLDDVQNNQDFLEDPVEETEAKVYELGFHIVPTIGEDGVKNEFDAVKKMIGEVKGSSLISEGAPELRTLAYTLSKTVKAVKTNYSQAYFGWIKFTANPDQIDSVKRSMEDRDSIIRYIIISTVRENTLVKDEEETEDGEERGDERAPKIAEDIDKTIDELVVQ